MKNQVIAATALLLAASAYADVGADYICQDKIETSLAAPAGTIDYWTNVATSYTNPQTQDVEVFVRGPGLVTTPVELTGDTSDQRWLRPIGSDFEGQGLYFTFNEAECQSLGGENLYCFRDRKETGSTILLAGFNELDQRKLYREAEAAAESVQVVMSEKNTLLSFVTKSGERFSMNLRCDSKEWYPHIRLDEMPRSDLN